MLRAHKESGAVATVAVKRAPVDDLSDVSIVNSDEEGRILTVTNYNDNLPGEKDIQIHIMVINRQFLLSQLTEALAHGYTSIAKDVLTRGAANNLFRIFRYEGYCETVRNLAEYYRRNMELLTGDVQEALFRQKNRPVLTKVQNSAPTVYAANSMVKNSLIADGCVIEGIVENSIIFRGVHVGKNTSVENCILMQDTYVGNNVYMNCVVTDKGVTIRDGRVLSGHESRPFYIEKSTEV
jgi:glucose-1-phosphate adenylyltransferase